MNPYLTPNTVGADGTFTTDVLWPCSEIDYSKRFVTQAEGGRAAVASPAFYQTNIVCDSMHVEWDKIRDEL